MKSKLQCIVGFTNKYILSNFYENKKLYCSLLIILAYKKKHNLFLISMMMMMMKKKNLFIFIVYTSGFIYKFLFDRGKKKHWYKFIVGLLCCVCIKKMKKKMRNKLNSLGNKKIFQSQNQVYFLQWKSTISFFDTFPVFMGF